MKKTNSFNISKIAYMFAFLGILLFTAGSVHAEKGWQLVTNTSELSIGDSIVIVAADFDYALGTTQKTNNRAAAAITKSGNLVVLTDDVQIITLEAGVSTGTYAFNVGTGYLYAAGNGTSGNYLKTQSMINDRASFAITIDESGATTVIAQTTATTCTHMRYNPNTDNGDPLFSCYKSSSSIVNLVTIYKYTEIASITVATPTFSVPAGLYATPQTVAISCATAGASILYTVDGSDPATNGIAYSTPLTISSNTTVKAIAVNGTDTSFMASATYTFPTQLANIAAFKSQTDNNTNFLIGNDVTFVFKSGAYTYVKDASAGLLIYGNTITTSYNEGDQISNLVGKRAVYSDQIEMSASFNTEPSTNNTGAVSPIVITMEELLDNYEQYDAQLITLQNVTFPDGMADAVSTTTITQNGSTSAIYNRFGLDTTLAAGATANVTGFAGIHNGEIQIQPRYNRDIALGVPPAPQPELNIVSPADGSTFSTLENITIEIEILDFTLGTDGLLKVECPLLPAYNMPNPSYLDDEGFNMFQELQLSNIPAGTYQATLTLVGLDHQPLSTPISASTTFTVVAPVLATPTITVTGESTGTADTYYLTANVTIDAVSGAAIHYTTDGSEPTETSTLYTAPFDVTTSCTVKAIATKALYANSAVASATIVIDTPTVAAPTLAPAGGVFTDDVIIFIVNNDTSATVRYTTDGTEPTETSTIYTSSFSISTTTTIKAKAFKAGWHASNTVTATYTIVNEPILTVTPSALTFSSSNLTGTFTVSAAFLAGPLTLTCDNAHFNLSQTSFPSANGNHIVTVTFDGQEPATGLVTITGGTLTTQVSLTATVTLPTPTITPESGTSDTLITVTMACSNSNAAIYYTTDGTTPDASSSLYMGPFDLTAVGDYTIKAIAILSCWDNSDVAIARYDVYHYMVARPTITPDDGTEDTRIYVTIDCSTPNSTIYYTTDGTTPSESSTLYTAPFDLTLPGTYTVNAIATRPNWDNSEIATATYTVMAPEPVATPVITPNGGFFYDSAVVSITCVTEAANIYYTLDGTTPTENSTLYSGPFTLNAETIVTAKAFSRDRPASETVSATFTFPVEVPNIAAFKAANSATNTTVYKITGDVTFVFENGANFYIQDSTAGLLIYDNPNNDVISRTYTEGDVISGGVCGTYTLYNGLVEMVPTRDLAAATSNTGTVSPVIATIADISTNYNQLESKLVKLSDVTFTQGGTFTTASASNIAIEQNGESMQVRNVFKTLDMTIDAGATADVTGFVLRYNTNYQIAPRSNYDIEINEVVLDTVAAPVIIVNPLTNDMVSIEITCATSGATIHYTFESADPDENATTYTGPIAFSDMNFTIKAIAVKEGMANSPVVTYNYTPDGIDDYESAIVIYPNPAVDQCTVTSEDGAIANVVVYDLYGKIVKSVQVNSNSAQIDMGGLAKGTYLIRVITDRGVSTQKVIKQ